MSQINLLLGQTFKHLADTQVAAQQIVEDYKKQYTIKKSNIARKSKKGEVYFVVTVEIEHTSEKDAFDMYFGGEE